MAANRASTPIGSGHIIRGVVAVNPLVYRQQGASVKSQIRRNRRLTFCTEACDLGVIRVVRTCARGSKPAGFRLRIRDSLRFSYKSIANKIEGDSCCHCEEIMKTGDVMLLLRARGGQSRHAMGWIATVMAILVVAFCLCDKTLAQVPGPMKISV